jgi:hypothetical protein
LDDETESIVSFGSKNSPSKTSVSGKRKLVPLAAVSIKQILAKQGIPEFNQPPFSSD